MIAPAISPAARPVLAIGEATGFEQWRLDRMIEARRILTNASNHRSTLVALAAHVVAASFPNGGAA
jgi:hypothetical protein